MATIELCDEQIDAIVVDQLTSSLEYCTTDQDEESKLYNEGMIVALKKVLRHFTTASQFNDIISKLGVQ